MSVHLKDSNLSAATIISIEKKIPYTNYIHIKPVAGWNTTSIHTLNVIISLFKDNCVVCGVSRAVEIYSMPASFRFIWFQRLICSPVKLINSKKKIELLMSSMSSVFSSRYKWRRWRKTWHNDDKYNVNWTLNGCEASSLPISNHFVFRSHFGRNIYCTLRMDTVFHTHLRWVTINYTHSRKSTENVF